jgi:hypothetical protein
MPSVSSFQSSSTDTFDILKSPSQRIGSASIGVGTPSNHVVLALIKNKMASKITNTHTNPKTMIFLKQGCVNIALYLSLSKWLPTIIGGIVDGMLNFFSSSGLPPLCHIVSCKLNINAYIFFHILPYFFISSLPNTP